MARNAATVGLLLALLCPGCAQVDRAVFDMNLALAQNLFEPMAKGYQTVVPKPIRSGLRNVTDNLRYTDVMVNNALQGKIDRMFSDAGRMAVNWVCFAGLFDAASDIGIPKYDEDFGQTLGVHGVAPGAYFNVPFIGPSTVRDVTLYPFRIVTNPLTWGVESLPLSLSLGATTYFFDRFDDVKDLSPVLEAVDSYAFVKEAFLERREFLVYDGNPPGKKEEEAEIDEALEGLEDLDDLDDLDGLDGLDDLDDLEGAEDGEMEAGPEESPDELDDLEGLDDLQDVDGTEPPPAPAAPAGGLPPPQIIRRSTPEVTKAKLRDVLGPARDKLFFTKRMDWSSVEGEADLPPPVVKKRGR